MIAWTLAFLAVASAAPQLQLPLQSQIIRGQPLQGQIISSQPLQGQYISSQPIQGQYISSQPLQGQIISGQQLGGQVISATQIPLVSNVQTSQALPISYQPQYQTVQTLQTAQPQLSLSSINYQPQQIRVQQVRPVTQLRTQSLKASLPIVSSTVAPVTVQPQVSRITLQPQVRVQVAQPQVHTIQVQQPQLHTVQVQQPQLHTIQVQQPQVHTVQVQQPQLHTVQVQQRVAPQVGVAILRQVQDIQDDGTYAFAFETENGIKAQEEGRSVNSGNSQSSIVQGSYSYTAPDGTPITVNYVADENGFRAEGEHIPKPSEEILRSLEYLRSLPPRPEDKDGQYVPDENGY